MDIHSEIERIGLKGVSLRLLHRLHLYPENFVIYDNSDFDEDELRTLLHGAGFSDEDKLGIRFTSPLTSSGLPRNVNIAGISEAIKYIKQNLRPKTYPIIARMTSVKYSGVLYSDGEKVIVDLWPGLEEYEVMCGFSNTIIDTAKETLFLTCRRHTSSRSLWKTEIYWKTANPIAFSKLEKIYRKLLNKKAKFEKLRKYFNPLLCEFHIDSKERILCMGVHESDKIDEEREANPISFNKITSTDDAEKWNGKGSAFVDVEVSRERLDELITLIHVLRGKTSSVYVKFGPCSHPAILFREAGILPILMTDLYNEVRITKAGT